MDCKSFTYTLQLHITCIMYMQYLLYFHLFLSMQSVQNLGLAVVPIVNGVIIDKVGYLILEVFFCICLCGEQL